MQITSNTLPADLKINNITKITAATNNRYIIKMRTILEDNYI